MKFVIYLVLLFELMQSSTEMVASGQLAAMSCITTQNLEGYAEKIAIFLTQDKAPIDDVKLNKFMNCYWKSKGFLSADGNINADHLGIYLENIFANGAPVTTTHRQVAQNTVDYCKDVRVKDPGQKAIIVQNCIMAFLRAQESALT